jgi:1-acyl-sn-glycerol-3-phosphate acyltransferase
MWGRIPELARQVAIVPEVERAIDAIPTDVSGYDPWGFSPAQSKLYYSLAYWVYRYFRPLVSGIETRPAGRAVVVANHSGQLPFDGVAIAVACLLQADPPRLVRPMAERWVPSLPFVNIAFSRAGVALGDPINCRNLLEAENAMLVFPEGAAGLGKPWSRRYQLEPFGRGFMRLALQATAPIVPVALVGAEEAIISLGQAKGLARLLGMPYVPVPALLPLLGPLSLLPLPTRFHLTFGEPMTFDGPFDDEDEAIDAKVAQVSQRIQQMLGDGLARRQSVFG